MKYKDYIIAILILLLVILSAVFTGRELAHLYKQRDYLYEIEEQQIRYLSGLNELNEGYNELYKDYRELYSDYQTLHISLSNSGWSEFIVTGYSANDPTQGTTNITASGIKTDIGLPIIAVDPDVIPLYSIVEIESLGAYISLDTGGAIRGQRIDVYFESKDDAQKFGRQNLMARIIFTTANYNRT